MKVEDLVGYDVIRTQPIDLGLFVDTSYMYYPVHVNKVDTYNQTVVVSDFKFNYQAILGVEWLDDNWEKAGDINQYKEPQYDKLNHIIKKGEHPKSMQDIMANAKAVTTNRVGDPDIFDNADGIITAGLEQATQEEADNFIKHLGANGSDYDSDYIKKESYKNDDLSNESILNNVLTTIDELRSGKVNGPNADALTIKLLIRKMDSMGVIPRNVDDDNSLIELEFPSNFDCEDSMIALQMAACAFSTFAQNIYLCSKTNPAYSVMITKIINDDGFYYDICGFNGNKAVGSDKYVALDEFTENKNIPKLVIYFQNNEDKLLDNAMRLINNGVKIIPDLTTILIADTTCVYDVGMLMIAMSVQGERDALLCIANDKIYVINHDKDSKKMHITKYYETGVVGVLDILNEDSKYDSTGIAILNYEDANEFIKFIIDTDNNGGSFYT